MKTLRLHAAQHVPAWLLVAAFLLISEPAVFALVNGANLAHAVGLSAGVFLAYFLLRGSRIAWSISAGTAIAQLVWVGTGEGTIWLAISATGVLCCLVLPSSRRYVWSTARRRAAGEPKPFVKSINDELIEAEYWGLGHLAGVEKRSAWFNLAVEKSGSVQRLALGLLLVVLVLAPVVGWAYGIHHGAASGNLFGDIAWIVLWCAYNILRLALLVLIVYGIHEYFTKRQRPTDISDTTPEAGG